MGRIVNINGERRELTPAEEAEGFPEATLDTLKATKRALIDSRTASLLADGFVWNGNRFSLVGAAVDNWNGMAIADGILTGALTFPRKVSQKDRSLNRVTLNNQAEFRAWYATGFGWSAAIQDAGAELIERVNSAQTKEELDEIIDNR